MRVFIPSFTYDPVKDFAPITLVATSYLLLVVHPSLPARSLKELIVLAKARPGELTFGSGGSGTTPHLAGELFKTMTGVSMVHVPYKGSPQSTTDLLAGRTDMGFANAAASLPFIRAGRLRVLGVTSPQRDPSLPAVPTDRGIRNTWIRCRAVVRDIRPRRDASRDRAEAQRGAGASDRTA